MPAKRSGFRLNNPPLRSRTGVRGPSTLVVLTALGLASTGCGAPVDPVSQAQALGAGSQALTIDASLQPVVFQGTASCQERGAEDLSEQECVFFAAELGLSFRTDEASTGACQSFSAEEIVYGASPDPSHSLLCKNEVTPSICENGRFNPDPNKYYTILSPKESPAAPPGNQARFIAAPHRFVPSVNGREPLVLTGADPLRYEYSGLDVDQESLVPSDGRLHFRFRANGEGYDIINRATGLTVQSAVHVDRSTNGFGGGDLGSDGEVLMLDVRTNGEAPAFAIECQGSRVVIRQGDKVVFDDPITAESVPEGSVHGASPTAVTAPFVFTEAGSQIKVTGRTPCMNKKKSCGVDTEEESFEQLHRHLCGSIFRQKHDLLCTRTVASQPLPEPIAAGWIVQEVQEFSRAAQTSIDPVQVERITLAANAVAKRGARFELGSAALGRASEVVQGSSPLTKAALAIGSQFLGSFGAGSTLFGSGGSTQLDSLVDDVNQSLENLAADIARYTQQLIAAEVAQNSIDQLEEVLRIGHDRFLKDYLRQKSGAISSFDDSLADSVEVPDDSVGLRVSVSEAEKLDDAAIAYEDGVRTFFGTDFENPELRTVLRAEGSLELLKFAIAQQLTMKAEATLLESMDNPSSCSRLADVDFTIPRVAETFRGMLIDSVAAVRAHGEQLLRESYVGPVSSSNLEDAVAEYQFDVTHFSYRIAEQLVFLEEIFEQTVADCERLRDPASDFRAAFSADTITLVEDDAAGDQSELLDPATDSDADGLSDIDELSRYATDRLEPDTDGDGVSDFDEVEQGTNPLVADSGSQG